ELEQFQVVGDLAAHGAKPRDLWLAPVPPANLLVLGPLGLPARPPIADRALAPVLTGRYDAETGSVRRERGIKHRDAHDPTSRSGRWVAHAAYFRPGRVSLVSLQSVLTQVGGHGMEIVAPHRPQRA